MGSHSEWKAKLALGCYLSLIGAVFLGALVVNILFLGLGIDYDGLQFPVGLVSLPINEIAILGVTLTFAWYKGAGFRELGLRRNNIKILVIASVIAVPLFLVGVGISVVEEAVFGPDPMAEAIELYVMPRDALQLVVMVILSLVLVGPCEELAFRGFVQRGFENSFGGWKGLLVASVLFGLVHGLNTLYAIVPTFVAGVVLGYVWQRTDGNTTAVALMHGINNSISITLAYLLTI